MGRFFSEVPSELDFLENLGVEPTESVSSDGFWSYCFEDDSAISLVLSFNQHAGSIQTSIFANDRELSTVSHEGLVSLRIEVADRETRLVGTCESKAELTKMIATVYPVVRLLWESLRTE